MSWGSRSGGFVRGEVERFFVGGLGVGFVVVEVGVGSIVFWVK